VGCRGLEERCEPVPGSERAAKEPIAWIRSLTTRTYRHRWSLSGLGKKRSVSRISVVGSEARRVGSRTTYRRRNIIGHENRYSDFLFGGSIGGYGTVVGHREWRLVPGLNTVAKSIARSSSSFRSRQTNKLLEMCYKMATDD